MYSKNKCSTFQILSNLSSCTERSRFGVFIFSYFTGDSGCVEVLVITMKPQHTEPKIESEVMESLSLNEQRRKRSTNHVYSSKFAQVPVLMYL